MKSEQIAIIANIIVSKKKKLTPPETSSFSLHKDHAGQPLHATIP